MALVMISVPVQYRIKDITKYLSVSHDPRSLVESVAYQQLSEYAASVNLDRLMGPDRDTFNHEFREILQRRLDQLDMGVEAAFVGLQEVHPPAKDNVAAAFQGVVSAETRMYATIRAAAGAARKMLTAVAGTEARAVLLDDAIRERDRAEPGTAEHREAEARVMDLMMGDAEKHIPPISGDSAVRIAEARIEAATRVSEAASKALTFGAQLAAYRAAPALYGERRFLEIFEGLETVRKFLIVGDRSNVTIEYETTRQAGLDQVLGEGLEAEKKKRTPQP
jgi:regulator of protease activity HflC (stomatin/prohibitin superfamily)